MIGERRERREDITHSSPPPVNSQQFPQKQEILPLSSQLNIWAEHQTINILNWNQGRHVQYITIAGGDNVTKLQFSGPAQTLSELVPPCHQWLRPGWLLIAS